MVEKMANTVPVLRKAMLVLEAVARNPEEATTKNLALSLDIPPTTCYRILRSFVGAGWLRARRGGNFALSTGLTPIFRTLLRNEILVETAREAVAAMASSTGLTAKLTVREGWSAVTIHSARPEKGVAITCQMGAESSLAVGSSGATHLSACPDEEIARVIESAPSGTWRFQRRHDVLQRVREARRQGVCFDRGSHATRVQTASVPLFDRRRGVAAVITVLGLSPDLDPSSRAALAADMKAVAASAGSAGLPRTD